MAKTRHVEENVKFYMFDGYTIRSFPFTFNKNYSNQTFNRRLASEATFNTQTHTFKKNLKLNFVTNVADCDQSDFKYFEDNTKETLQGWREIDAYVFPKEPLPLINYEFITEIFIDNKSVSTIINNDKCEQLKINDAWKKHIEPAYNICINYIKTQLAPVKIEKKSRLAWAPAFLQKGVTTIDTLSHKFRKDLADCKLNANEIKNLSEEIKKLSKITNENEKKEATDKLLNNLQPKIKQITLKYFADLMQSAQSMSQGLSKYLEDNDKDTDTPARKASSCSIM